ncbi:hypothetical protein JCM19992_04180 [Thermostilla marina]
MDERIAQFRIGVMVLASIIITAILIVTFGEWKWPFPDQYTIYIRFDQAPGVSRKSPLRKSGILIGQVEDVALQEDGTVLVTAKIDRKYVIRHNEVCRLNQALLGDSTLEFTRATNAAQLPNTPVEPGETIPGVLAIDPVKVVEEMQQRLATAVDSVAGTSQELQKTMRTINDMLDENHDRISRILANADETVALARETVANTNDIVGDPELKERLRESLDRVPTLIDDLQTTLKGLDQTVGLANENLSNLRGFTEPLSERGGSLVTRIDSSLAKLDTIMSELETFSQSLNNSDGSLAQLIHDRELYDRVNRTLANVEEITKQVKPILNDMRVFSDKIARHPETLGVRGAIQRNPGTKGVPPFTQPILR